MERANPAMSENTARKLTPPLIPVPMCHGIGPNLLPDFFEECLIIAKGLGFESINYDQLVAWLEGRGALPVRPIMFTFDHAFCNILVCQQIMGKYGYSGTLFVDTYRVEKEVALNRPYNQRPVMNWQELQELVRRGWDIGGHTHDHVQACDALQLDPSGSDLKQDMIRNNQILSEHCKVAIKDFAYAGPSWAPKADEIVKDLYRTARLWITRATMQVENQEVRYADFMGSDEPDAADGGPAFNLRYITKTSDPYRLPSVEWTTLLNTPEKFREYLEYACLVQNQEFRPGA